MTAIKQSFVVELFSLLWAAKNILFFNIMMIAGGAIVFHHEGLKNSDGTWLDSAYAALITSLTIGYGDMTPIGLYGKIASVLLGIVGMLFVGVIVGATIKALERCR
ncbi:potassium channel family protein [Bacteroidota bacterium]